MDPKPGFHAALAGAPGTGLLNYSTRHVFAFSRALLHGLLGILTITIKAFCQDRRTALVLVLLPCFFGPLPTLHAEPTSALSITKQFVCRDDRRTGQSELATKLTGNTNFVVLDPGLMAVGCERIKKNLYNDLGSTAVWSGRVLLVLHGAEFPDEIITLTSERFQDRWQYRLDLPDVTERSRFVRAIVQVLLLEMASRSGPQRSAEPPLWLVEGLTRQLIASSETEIILAAPGKNLNNPRLNYSVYDSEKQNPLERVRKLDPLQHAREVLPVHPRLTFDQLSWPADDQLLGDQAEVFYLSSQLLVVELLRLPDGQAAMREMLAQLPNYYNWQFAMLRAYHSSFERLIDVEKWWALRWVSLSGLPSGPTFTLEESWKRLDQALHWPARANTGTNAAAVEMSVPLQTVVQDFDLDKQTEPLQRRLEELALLRPRAEPSVAALIGGYIQTIQTYMKGKTSSGFFLGLRKTATANNAKQKAIRELNRLDEQRLALKAKSSPLADAGIPKSPEIK